jgi:signal transduction histidine kinase
VYAKNLTNKQIILICTAFAAGIFAVDVTSLPLGVAAGVPYVAVVLVSLWQSQWKATLFVTIGVTILTIFGFLLSEPAGIPWMVVTNRVLALVAIWLTAVIGGWLVFSRREKSDQALQRAQEETDRAIKAKARFLESTSDAMRQDLQTLTLLGAVMRKIVADPKALEICKSQDEAVANLDDLLNSILEFYELESGSVEPQIDEAPIQEIFQQLQEEFAARAKAKGLQLAFSSHAEVAFSDSKLLTQILRSLISNAVHYTNQGTVDVSCQRESGGLRVTVRDSGIGIAPDEVSIIFDEFYQVKSDPVGRNSGRGLGLSIVDRGLTLLQSKIEVETELGRGSSFSFVVPAAA